MDIFITLLMNVRLPISITAILFNLFKNTVSIYQPHAIFQSKIISMKKATCRKADGFNFTICGLAISYMSLLRFLA